MSKIAGIYEHMKNCQLYIERLSSYKSIVNVRVHLNYFFLIADTLIKASYDLRDCERELNTPQKRDDLIKEWLDYFDAKAKFSIFEQLESIVSPLRQIIKTKESRFQRRFDYEEPSYVMMRSFKEQMDRLSVYDRMCSIRLLSDYERNKRYSYKNLFFVLNVLVERFANVVNKTKCLFEEDSDFNDAIQRLKNCNIATNDLNQLCEKTNEKQNCDTKENTDDIPNYLQERFKTLDEYHVLRRPTDPLPGEGCKRGRKKAAEGGEIKINVEKDCTIYKRNEFHAIIYLAYRINHSPNNILCNSKKWEEAISKKCFVHPNTIKKGLSKEYNNNGKKKSISNILGSENIIDEIKKFTELVDQVNIIIKWVNDSSEIKEKWKTISESN